MKWDRKEQQEKCNLKAVKKHANICVSMYTYPNR